MVGGTSNDACWKDRRHALADIPAGRPGNSKGVRWSLGLLADLTVRQLRFVRAKKRNVDAISDAMRHGCSGRNWNDPRAGERLWRIGPYLTTADARSRKRFGSGKG